MIRGAFCYSIYMKMYVGIDEVGRGPLAGPVCVGVFSCDQKTLKWILKNAPCKITDSKKMTAKNRAAVVKFIESLGTPLKTERKQAFLNFKYSVGYTSASFIDKHGIVLAISSAMKKACDKVASGVDDYYVLDGGLKLPVEYKRQKTIIKGDLSEPIISLASIVAKESRDDFMKKLGKKYPVYGFENHMGYGTLAHRRAIQKVGQISGIHRKSFIKNRPER